MFSSIQMLNPPAHTRLRRLVSAAFTPRRVAGLRPAAERIVAHACEQVAGDTDFVASFAFPLPVTVIGELLGVPEADRGDVPGPGPGLDTGTGGTQPAAPGSRRVSGAELLLRRQLRAGDRHDGQQLAQS